MFFGRKYSIQIPEPCHESWDRMHPVDRGRFCDSCSKVVTDFTGMTEKEIAAFFMNRPQGICGRFKQEQLQTQYIPPLTITLPFHKRLIRYAVSLFLMGGAAKQVKSQSQDSIAVQQDSLRKDSLVSVSEPILHDSVKTETDSVEIVQVDSEKMKSLQPETVYVWQTIVTGNVAPEYIEISGEVDLKSICSTTGFVIYQDPEPRVSYPKRLADTLSKVICLFGGKGLKTEEPNGFIEKTQSSPKKPLPNPARDRRIEGILPAFFSWRGKKSSANGKSS